MVNKKIWLGMLVMVLVFGMSVISCGDDDGGSGEKDTWTDVTSLTQLNGTWKGSASQTQSQQGITMKMTMEMTMTIVATDASTGTSSGSQKAIQTLSGSGDLFNSVWASWKEDAEGEEGVIIDEPKHSISWTNTISSQPISLSDMEGLKINQNGKKVKLPASQIGLGEDASDMIFIKQ